MKGVQLGWECRFKKAVLLRWCLLLLLSVTEASSCSDLTQHKNWPLLSDVSCGRAPAGAAPSSRIYNGKDASLGEYPWLARLMARDDNGTELGICGGSIINNRYVLTAGHCCLSKMPLQYVSVGEHDIESEVDCQDGFCAPPVVNITVESFVTHPGYKSNQFEFDICLVRLAQPLVFTDYVRPACLPLDCEAQEDDLLGTKLEIAGFGIIPNFSNVYTAATVLQKAEQQVVPLDVCRRIWNGVFSISDAEMCTLGQSDPSQTCQGDSGGPVMALSADKEPSVVGIISHGWTCLLIIYYGAAPAVSVKVSAYLTWILDNISA